jgi:hypothetical protein
MDEPVQSPRDQELPWAPGPYGLPPERLHRAWRIEDIAEFLGIGLTKARALMKTPGAPARLRTGSERCDRWNAWDVLTWLHDPGERADDSVWNAPVSSQDADDAPAEAVRTRVAGQAPLTRSRQRRSA